MENSAIEAAPAAPEGAPAVTAAAPEAAPAVTAAAPEAAPAAPSERAPDTGPDPDNQPITDWGAVRLDLREGQFDAAVVEDFGRVATDMGLTPNQARALARWQTEQIAGARERMLESGARELSREWGAKAETNRQAVLSLISRIDRLTGDDSFSRALGESGATCFPGVVRGLLALARLTDEDSPGASGGASGGMTEESAFDGLKTPLARRAGPGDNERRIDS